MLNGVNMSTETTLTGTVAGGFAQILENNRQELAKIEKIRNKSISHWPRNLVFAAAFTAMVFVMGMFLMHIITGVLALGTLVFSGVAIFLVLRFLRAMDPLIQQKTKNFLVNKMADEARKNAVAQLDNQVIINTERLAVAREARNKMGAAVKSLQSKINEANAGKPSYERKKEILEQVEEAYEHIKTKLDLAAKANKQFEEKVKEYKDMESFAAQASEAMAIIKHSGDDQLENMLSLEAFNQIERDFNTAITDIENNVRDMTLDD
jgi:biopolymer transport protein ExbB/TolQ